MTDLPPKQGIINTEMVQFYFKRLRVCRNPDLSTRRSTSVVHAEAERTHAILQDVLRQVLDSKFVTGTGFRSKVFFFLTIILKDINLLEALCT